MKARHICAIVGIAVAVGSVVFMQSLVATNDAQAPKVAERLTAPWQVWKVEGLRLRGRGTFSKSSHPDESSRVKADLPRPDLSLPCLSLQIDYRPGGHVLQGPPMTGVVAAAPEASPYQSAPLVEGRWVDEASTTPEIVCTRGMMMRFGHGEPPPLGTRVKFIGEKGAVSLTIVGYLDAVRLPMGWPGGFANRSGFAALAEEPKGRIDFWRGPVDGADVQTARTIASQFTSDAGRNMDRAKPLLLWAAALTAFCLLLNSLFLSVEARRRELAILRMLGLTRAGVARTVMSEALKLTLAGTVVGMLFACLGLWGFVSVEQGVFPMGAAIAWKGLLVVVGLSPVIAMLGALFALKPAFAVRPLEAVSGLSPRSRHIGMLIAFAFGFGAFVAVEVWGASLTKPFIPSHQWPDAIVSILPGGVSSFDIEKLRHVPGVRRIAELQPLQVNFDPLEEMSSWGGATSGPKQYRNALVLASDWLPSFVFREGDYATAEKAIREGDACVITEMMARARKLHMGDDLRLDAGRGLKMSLRIVGIVDLNWHMVTSRGLLRGLNRMPVNTDGPVFVSFDTIQALDLRPAEFVNMTHLWLDYEPAFLSEHGVFPAGRIVEQRIVAALNGANHVTKDGTVRGNAVRLHSRDEVADGTLAHGTELVGAMARIPFVFIAVLSLGFIAMLVASADARKREFIVLRAIGATRVQIAWVLIREAVRTAGFALVLGLFGGALIGWLATAGTRAAMSNWGLPACFDLPLGTIAAGAAGAVAFTLIVAVPTALTLVRPKRG